jgi:tRNA (guanine-N7-)-methyltransferase
MFVREFEAQFIKKPKDFKTFEFNHQDKDLIIDLEIGCGVGWHPLIYVKNHPERFLIAIERTHEKFQKFKRRFDSHGKPANLFPVHADAVAWVTHALPEHSCSRILIPYPNPYPKNAAQRWIRMPFFRRLLQVLKPEGEIVFMTNIKTYRDEALDYGLNYWGLSLKLSREFDLAGVGSGQNHEFRTHFEKKYLERGETCYEIQFQKPPLGLS